MLTFTSGWLVYRNMMTLVCEGAAARVTNCLWSSVFYLFSKELFN